MEYQDLLYYIQHVGTDPSRLIFEDELTGIYNRRFLLNYFQYKVSWDSLESQPVSLLMMDLDYFKEVNDTYGHTAGDKVLIWVANLLKELSADKGLAIRYAGDEFMILMPDADKQAALQMGEQVIQRLHEEPVLLPDVDSGVHITLSIGVASAPDDAHTGKSLIHKADTALYYAKKTGRDRLANAEQVTPEDVFAKTALHRLEGATITGRRSQLVEVATALKKFGKRQSQFLIVDGATGMGKSEFLKTIRRNLAQTKIWQISVNGIAQEGFRPYYLTSNILVEILNQRPDKGAGIFDDLTPQEANYLSHILPQLGEPEAVSPEEDEMALRENIFATLVHFIPKLVNSRPLILLIDDLHSSDEASLLLLRQLLLRGDLPLFVCGTATIIQPDSSPGAATPLERFLANYEQELSIGKVTLTPLTDADIGQHFKGMFPHVSLPENFEDDLALLTHGNPLFLSEIQRKLVLDGKITLAGQQWVIKPLEEDYLPRSLEEIVSQKIAVLDEESRHLLDQASTFGENVSLSMLTGSSENRETKVLEFVDQAIAQGLIRSDYQINDETIRFLSKRVLEITYGGIQEGRKQELHEHIGNYQETLYEQRLLPSAATLAYHFQLSANQEKARIYQEFQQSHNSKIFNGEEAITYTGERPEDGRPEDIPLDPDSLPHIPGAIRALLTTVRNIKLYPPGSAAIVSATRQLKETIDKILSRNDRLNITIAEDDLVVNTETVEVTQFKSVAEAFTKFMRRLELKGIAFSRGLSENELRAMLEALGRTSKKMIDRGFWKRYAAEQRLFHIEFNQVRYTTVAETHEAVGESESRPDAGRVAPAKDAATRLAVDKGLDEQVLNQIPEVIRCLLTAVSNIKLYPPESTAITRSVEQVIQALRSILIKLPAITLARVGTSSLLINGEKVDTSDFETLARAFLALLDSVELRSLTFLENVSATELVTFIGTLGHKPAEVSDSGFWIRFAREKGFSSILFNQLLYGILEDRVGYGQVEALEDSVGQTEPDPTEPLTDIQVDPETQIPSEPMEEEIPAEAVLSEGDAVVLTEASLESMAEQLRKLLLKGNESQSRELINQLFLDFGRQAPHIRRKVIYVCASLLEDLMLASQPTWVEVFTEPLLLVSAEEKDLEILRKIAALLSQSGANLIQFGDYQQASRIFKHLLDRQREVLEDTDERILPSSTVFTQELEPKTRMVLMADLQSQEPSRLRRVSQLLVSLGPMATDLLIEVIKREDNLRVRQIAAHLLKELGPEAVKHLKRELVLEGFAEERVRILDVIDNVTQDVKTELAYALGDVNPKVRRAAFGLCERLNDAEVTSLLLDYANHDDPSTAVAAIKALGKIKPAGATDALVALLDSAKETERLIACCRALGQIADPATIEPLAKMLAPGGFLSLRKKRSNLVRATAAFALAQIPDPRVAEILAPYLEDRDPRVRRIAQDKAG
ncbi:MAG: diguanylate cyclase [Deltaproteobacteria bacterium]|nr:MAG: diguanylate cyclase [Deltaproteobacteria bacterium]